MSGPRLSIIPARAATDPELKPRDLQVLCVLGRHTDDLGWCRKSQVKMAEEMGCARSTVFDAIERLVKAGYLERHVQEEENGRDSPHVYRVILDPAHPRVNAVRDADDPCRYTGTPADISAPPAGPEPAPPAGPGPAPKNDPFRTTDSEREERGARDGDGEQGAGHEARDPRTLEKRVKRMAARLNWPNWANSSTDWTVVQFAKLSPEERDRAEERGAAYLAHCGRKALSLGTYFLERKFDDLPESLLRSMAEAEQRVVAPPFGKLWSAVRIARLLAPPGPLPRASAFVEALMAEDSERGERERLAHRARNGWPAVNDMHRAAENRRGLVVGRDQQWMEPLATTFEAVRVGSELWRAWEAEHVRRGWPWVPDPGRQEWVYFPAGGPAGLAAFEAAIRSEASDHDGGGREAAE